MERNSGPAASGSVMSRVTRRVLLRDTGLAVTVPVAGCGVRSGGDVFSPAGSLGFANLDGLPHALGIRVVDAPETYLTDDGDERGVPLPQRGLLSMARCPEPRVPEPCRSTHRRVTPDGTFRWKPAKRARRQGW
jgi:hypothetical protein